MLVDMNLSLVAWSSPRLDCFRLPIICWRCSISDRKSWIYLITKPASTQAITLRVGLGKNLSKT
jgi:hypothetical protein